MKIQIENTEAGKVYVGMTLSGRKYRGASMDEVNRKYLLAILHMHKKQIGDEVFTDLCASMFSGRTHLSDLTIAEMYKLKSTLVDAVRFGEKIENSQQIEPMITVRQRKSIIRLGRYVLGEHYGKDWFWKKLNEWTKKSKLDDLTVAEARYVIERLEKIEKRLGIEKQRAANGKEI